MARPVDGYWRDSVRVISNTEALQGSRVRRWSGSRESWERRAVIGRAVHEATAVLDINGVAWESAPREWIEIFDAVDREVGGFVRAWERCKREQQITVRLVEHTFFAKYRITEFATTLDREGLRRGEPAIIELKTPKVSEPYWGVQLAGQEFAAVANLGPPRVRPFKYQRWVAQLFADGRYKLLPYTSETDIEIFGASLTVAVWNRNNYGD